MVFQPQTFLPHKTDRWRAGQIGLIAQIKVFLIWIEIRWCVLNVLVILTPIVAGPMRQRLPSIQIGARFHSPSVSKRSAETAFLKLRHCGGNNANQLGFVLFRATRSQMPPWPQKTRGQFSKNMHQSQPVITDHKQLDFVDVDKRVF